MANAVYAMSGPTKIIELDGTERSKWRFEDKALHLWEGKLWRKEAVGCVKCVEKEGVDYTTLSRAEGAEGDKPEEHFHCMHHGPLDEVPYEMVKKYTVTIGGVVREGDVSVKDTMLFPASMNAEERTTLIEKLLEEAEDEEKSSGASPDDDADE